MILSSLPYLLEGTLTTIQLAIVSMILGFVLGLSLAFGQVYGNKFIKSTISVYERIARSIPLVVILFLIYFGLPQINFIDIKIPDFMAAVLGLGLRSAAYQSQIYRGAIQSVSGSQMKAALSMGMNSFTAFFYVILPQAVRIAIPPIGNEAAILLKDTSVVYAIGMSELLRQAFYIFTNNGEATTILLLAAFIYYVLTMSINRLLSVFEKKYRIPGIGIEGGVHE